MLALKEMIQRVALVALCVLPQTYGLNIILNNDDGWASVNLRELYRALNEGGHNAWIVAPASDQSGKGGRIVFSPSKTLTTPGVFDSLPTGAPAFGTEKSDPKIWYYDGSPAACTLFALDYVVSNFWNGSKPDLVVTGPNFGTNGGPGMYTLSGTLAGAYTAVGRGVPAVALSAGNGPGRGFKELKPGTASGYPDPATILAGLSTQLIEQLAKKNFSDGILPQGYGVNVNFPTISSLTDDSCISPPFIHTRMTGGSHSFQALFNKDAGTFSIGDTNPGNDRGLNACINGNCSLPGEETLRNCQTATSLFTVDYDAPDNRNGDAIVLGVLPLQPSNGTKGTVVEQTGTSAATSKAASSTAKSSAVRSGMTSSAVLSVVFLAAFALS